MTAYDELQAAALDALGRNLTQRGVEPQDRAQLLDAISRLNFPAFLGLLSTSGESGDAEVVGQPLLRSAARDVAGTAPVQQLHVTPDDVERALTAIFVHGAGADTALPNPATRDVVLRAAIDRLGTQAGIPLTPDQVSEAIQLLSTGEFFGDLASTIATVAFAIRSLPIDLVQDVGHLPHRMLALVAAVTMDLAGTPFVALRVLQDLLEDGKLDHPPAILRHTMARLLDFATAGTTAHTISDLIAPDNRSVRLAIVIYARANGIPLEESDLDLLRTDVLNTQTPDLGPVLVAAVDRFIDRNGEGQVLTALQQIAASRG